MCGIANPVYRSNGYERSGSGDGYGYGYGVRPRVATVFCGSAESCRCVLQDSSTVNRRPVPHKSASLQIQAPDAAENQHLQISALFCGSRNLFWGQGTTWKLHPPIPRRGRIPWQQMEKFKCGCGGAEASPPALPAGRELTAGSLGKSRVYTAEDPGFFTQGHLVTIRATPKRESTAETCLEPGPQVASPCLMHHQQEVTANRLTENSDLLRERQPVKPAWSWLRIL